MTQLSKRNSSAVKRTVVIIALLISIVGLFEFLPAVDSSRAMFPADWHKEWSCHDVLTARAWYGQINPWHWFWFVYTPIVTFSARPDTSAWQRSVRTVLIVAVSYIVFNLGTHLGVDIRNAPFQTSEITSSSNETERFKFGCFDTTDGPNYVFAALFGWVPASIYAGWWEIAWGVYHKKKTRLIGASFKRDWVSRIVVYISVAVPVFFSVLTYAEWLRH